jgi:hypothetical protein
MPKAVAGRPGWVEGTVQELLGLTDREMQRIESRLEAARSAGEPDRRSRGRRGPRKDRRR